MADEQAPPVADNMLWRVETWFPSLSLEVLAALKLYHHELIKFNARLNLVSHGTERDADEVHFADCLSAFACIKPSDFKGSVHDFGSGNGFPGIVFAVLAPEAEFVLVESDVRKCEFLKHVAHVLGLTNVRVLCDRIEALGVDSVEVAISRGLASITKTCFLGNRLLKRGGRLYHLKGSAWSTEISEMPTQLISNWSPELSGEYVLAVSQAKRAVVCTTKKS